MRFGILGPLEVLAEDGARLDPAAARQRRLLLALLVAGDRPVSADRLVEAVWSDPTELPKEPTRTLRTYVTRLRRALEPDEVGGHATLLVGGPDRYHLRLDGHHLDAHRFETALTDATSLAADDPGEALRRLEVGLALWRGPALEEVADEDWAKPEAVRLDELRLTAEELRFRCLLDTERHEQAIGDLERHVRAYPLRERPHGQLMLALHRSGRTAEASEVFHTFRARLADEAGLDPSPSLDGLHRRLLAGDDPAHTAGGATWNLLPEPRTPLVGRDALTGDVVERCRHARVLTLAGVGGVGKTRLAIEVARRWRAGGDAVLFVDLGVVTAGDDLVDALFSALRLPATARGDHLDGLVRVLRSQPALLVLDNCEHLVDAVADLVERLTHDAPELTVLATSREVLGVDGEHVHRVPSLDDDAGVELFRARAAAVSTTNEVPTAANGQIAEICRRLDGIPLAIELAAARTAHLTVAAIAEHLDERFWLLAGSRRSLGRHQTLQAAMDWSHDLLTPEQQAVLRAAAVFVGDFDAAGLADVIDLPERTILDHLRSLVDCSLVDLRPVAATDDGQPARTRYRLLETVRLYAQERLADAGELAARRRAHAEVFLARTVEHPPRTVDTFQWVLTPGDHTDLGNQLAALDWFDHEGRLADLGRLVARLPTVLCHAGFIDPEYRYLGRDDVGPAIDDPDERALYLAASAINASRTGDYDRQHRFSEAARAEAVDPGTRATATMLLANAWLVSDPPRVPGLVADSLDDVPADAAFLRQELRLQVPLALIREDRLDEARPLLMDLHAEGNDFAGAELMLVLHLLGEDGLALEIPRPGELDPAFALWDYRWWLVRALVAAGDGRSEEAAAWLVEAGSRIDAVPVGLLDRDLLIGCAAHAFHAGDPASASRLLATSGGYARSPGSFAVYVRYRDLVKPLLSPQEREAIRAQGSKADPATVLDAELGRLRHLVPAS